MLPFTFGSTSQPQVPLNSASVIHETEHNVTDMPHPRVKDKDDDHMAST